MKRWFKFHAFLLTKCLVRWAWASVKEILLEHEYVKSYENDMNTSFCVTFSVFFAARWVLDSGNLQISLKSFLALHISK